MIIGAHISTKGGLRTVLERGQDIKAEALQIFPSAPVQWKIRGFSDSEKEIFKNSWPALFKEVIFHGIYLTNLAATSIENRQKTLQAIIDTLNLAPQLGITKTVIHAGSYQEDRSILKPQIKDILNQIFDQTAENSQLLYENTAGSTIGAKLEDLEWLLSVSPAKRAGICLDTCHAFASGYDLVSDESYEKYLSEVDKTIGLEKVLAWHLNDSKFDFNQKRDRHENIGQGKMGLKVFSLLLNDSRWQDVSGYLEVPGFDDLGPDLKNVEILKNLRQQKDD